MKPPNGRRKFDWEAAGRELGETLGDYHAIVVIGVDPVTTGRVALGIARVQAMHRRAAVGDLFAESPPIQELVQTDDPHGLVDSFLYGVSLSRIAYLVPDAGQLFVMPSGTEPPDYEEILPNPRWERLAAGFREVHALLVLACPASAPQIEKLVAATDGAILVGDVEPPSVRVIGSVREPRKGPPPLIGVPTNHNALRPPWSRRQIAAAVGVCLTLTAAAAAAWLAYRPLAGASRPWAMVPDCAAKAKAGQPCTTDGRPNVLGITPDSTRRDSLADTMARAALAAAPAATLPSVANPADSLGASPFAVELMAANTQAGAILKLQKDGKNLPAATFSPAVSQGARWFKVVSGAFSNRADAESLLVSLKRRNLLRGGESVVRLPFAFLIESVKATAVTGMVASYADRGQPVYALRQPDGSTWLLVGAFESVEQAALYVESLRASGIVPVLVYRKGRSF